ncbi:MAG: PKD domain-containing protein [Ginsengibacter sp.]
MKKILLICSAICMMLPCMASHIVGGEMIYSYQGPGSSANTSSYIVTLKLFRDQNCTSCAQMPTDVYIGFFNNDNGSQYPAPNQYFDVEKNDESQVAVNPFPPCISNPPSLKYDVATFTVTISLPNNGKGYTASYQTCCRVHPLDNVFNDAGAGGGTGATYSCSIPAVHDNSPVFATSVDAICRLKHFTLRFNATDADADSLVYAFAPAFNGGSTQSSANVNPDPPPYNSVNYINGFDYVAPLGTKAGIDAQTGIISGIAPDVGRYVVCVAVKSYRKGVFVNEHLKDFIVNVTDCDFAGVELDPKPVSCDGFNVSFTNDNRSPQNLTFFWEFGDPASGRADTSTLRTPTHIYTDTGLFVYKLVINRGQQCSDSAIQIRKVYPGFFPGFASEGRCINAAVKFTDITKSKYGLVNAWRWNFGDPSVTNDTAVIQNPSYSYKSVGNYSVQLVVSNDKGCVKSIIDTISIIDKPVFKITDDTLICSIDTLQLMATGTGNILWTPGYNINNQNSFNPLVSPKVTTTYSATLTETPGCFATQNVVVSVVDRVSLNVGNDSTVCQTDSIRLNAVSNGLHYLWTPAASLNNNMLKNPLAAPSATTKYNVVASIGKCNTSDDITLRVVPYPEANGGSDTTICFPASIKLHATGGSSYVWSPTVFLTNANIPDPVANPTQSIRYIVAVTDVLGCPKPAYDTIFVEVEKLVANAGPRDTSIVVNQPLQLNATGGEIFLWKPSTGLNNTGISNPIATLSENQQYILTVESNEGCTATDTIDVLVYKVDPGLYVPNAFTPNGDGVNDFFRPILIGMKYLKYFRVYNRSGELIFSTSVQNAGWDGTFKGKAQDADVYVWIVDGIDYQNKEIFRKGSVTLVR